MMKRAKNRARVLFAIGTAFGVITPAPSRAQDITTEARWEIDAHVGIMGAGVGGGTSVPLPSAAGFTTATGAASAAVSSWFFGPGAALFNQVAGSTGGATIIPLDQMLERGISRRRGGINLGLGVARWLSPRWALEVNGDYAPSGVVMNDRTLAAMVDTPPSYTEAWTRFLESGPAADGFPIDVVVTGGAERGGGHQFVLTGGLKAVVHTRRRFRSYVGGGAGISITSTRPIVATLNGAYQFAANVTTPGGVRPVLFSERDDVSVRAAFGPTRNVVGTVHGGFEYYSDSTRGVRFDVAVLLGRHVVGTQIDATPAVFVQEDGAAIAGTTSPTIQFSSLPASAVRSTLTGPTIRGVETFRTDGVQAQVKLSVAYFRRF